MNPRSNGSLIAIIIAVIVVVIIAIAYAFLARAADIELAQEISPNNPEIAEPYIVGRDVTSTSTGQWLFCFKKAHLDAILDFHMLVGGKSAYQLFLERYAMQIDPETGWFRCGYASGKIRWQIVEAWSPKPCFLGGKLRSCTVIRLAIPNYPDSLWSNYHVFTDRKVLRIPPGERVWSDPLEMFRPTAQSAVGHTFLTEPSALVHLGVEPPNAAKRGGGRLLFHPCRLCRGRFLQVYQHPCGFSRGTRSRSHLSPSTFRERCWAKLFDRVMLNN